MEAIAQQRPFSVAALAAYWEVSDQFIYDEIRAGRLRAFKLGGKLWRIRPEAVEEYECRGVTQSGGCAESSASSGPIQQQRQDAADMRLERQIELPRRPRLVSSGAAGR